MLYNTHIMGGFAAGLIVSGGNLGSIEEIAIATLIAGGAALLPDIDTPKSFLGSKLLFVSIPAKLTLGHRGLFHSLSVVVALLLIKICLGLDGIYYSAFVAGYASHIFLDMLTPEGVPLVWPLKKRLCLPLFRTGGIAEYILMYILICFVVLILIHILIYMVLPMVESLKGGN